MMSLPHILLIEDNLEDVELLKIALAKTGLPHTFRSVNFAREAVMYLARIGEYRDEEKFPKPSLVILDLSLPGMSGLDFLIWATGEPRTNIPPVIVMSCSTDETDQYLAKRFGVNEYFVKSIDSKKTVEAIKQILIASPPVTFPGPDYRPHTEIP
jgi:CheY-like chemotaxis protein